jgi:hypothetical protein
MLRWRATSQLQRCRCARAACLCHFQHPHAVWRQCSTMQPEPCCAAAELTVSEVRVLSLSLVSGLTSSHASPGLSSKRQLLLLCWVPTNSTSFLVVRGCGGSAEVCVVSACCYLLLPGTFAANSQGRLGMATRTRPMRMLSTAAGILATAYLQRYIMGTGVRLWTAAMMREIMRPQV